MLDEEALKRFEQEEQENYLSNWKSDHEKFKQENLRIRKEIDKVVEEVKLAKDGEAVGR